MARNDLTKQTKKHLLLLARRAGLTGAGRLGKAELIARLTQAVLAPPSSAVPATVPDDLSIQTHRSLLELARQKGLPGVGRLRKTDLIARLVAVTSTPPPSPTPVSSHKVAEPEQIIPVATQSVDEGQPISTESLLVAESTDTSLPPAPALPSGYNDNRLVLLARDPHWLYAYWDFSTEEISAVLTRLGAQEARPILRVFDVTYLDFDGANAWNHLDIELTPFATSWYIPVPRPDAAYCAEVGYQSPDGHFAALGRSNIVSTPRDGVSPDATLRWVTPPEQQPSPLPSPQTHPVPLTTIPGPSGQEAHSPLSAPSSAQHPSSWSFARGASPAHVRSGTIAG